MPIFPCDRIVVVAKQKDLRENRTGFSFFCGRDCVSQFGGIEGNAKNVTRDFSDRGEDNDAAVMCILPDRWIIGVTITDLISDLRDRFLVADETMPAIGRTWPAIAPEVNPFLLGRCRRRFRRIDAYFDNIEIGADTALQICERVDETVVDHRAKHWAPVITENEDHRSLSQQLAEFQAVSGFTSKSEIARNLQAGVLFELHPTQIGSS